MVRLSVPLAPLADRFVRYRPGNMRGVDLNRFDFDYDLTWYAFVLTPEGEILNRFGGREPEKVAAYHNLQAFRETLDHSLAAFQQLEKNASLRAPKRSQVAKRAEDFPGARRFGDQGCIHCHHVHEMRWEERRATGAWKIQEMWIYPPLRNLGVGVEPGHGFRVREVMPDSIAARAGLKVGDIFEEANGVAIASAADLQWAVHRMPDSGEASIQWRREGRSLNARLKLPQNWRVSDISWRWSIRSLKPSPGISGEDLTREERTKLGLTAEGLAFRQGPFAPLAVRQAGLQTGDVVWGLDGKTLKMSARQFDTHLRLYHRVGETVRYEILRGSEKRSIPYKLSE